MYLFFDTETTGLPKQFNSSISELANWPYLVQLAYIVYDEYGNELDSNDIIIRPNGFIISAESTKFHNITNDIAIDIGVPILEALSEFNEKVLNSSIIVAHNLQFDQKILEVEFLRNGLINYLPFKQKVCTMLSTTEFCKIKGVSGYKWPTLSELFFKLFEYDFNGAHNAINDVKATGTCYWQLVDLGIIKKMDKQTLENKANWIKGFIESLEFSDNVSNKQIALLKSKFYEFYSALENHFNDEESQSSSDDDLPF